MDLEDQLQLFFVESLVLGEGNFAKLCYGLIERHSLSKVQ